MHFTYILHTSKANCPQRMDLDDQDNDWNCKDGQECRHGPLLAESKFPQHSLDMLKLFSCLGVPPISGHRGCEASIHYLAPYKCSKQWGTNSWETWYQVEPNKTTFSPSLITDLSLHLCSITHTASSKSENWQTQMESSVHILRYTSWCKNRTVSHQLLDESIHLMWPRGFFSCVKTRDYFWHDQRTWNWDSNLQFTALLR